MNKTEKRRLKFSLIFPVFFLMIMWIVKIYEYSFGPDLYKYGIYPLSIKNIPGIFFAPFIHGDFEHIFSNTFPFLLLGTALFYFYGDIAYKVFFLLYFFSGFWVWIAAREAYHIGASGIIYGLASFLFFSGLIHKRRSLASLSLVIVFIYGSMVWGIFPINEGMSWEGHLFGAITGFLLAIAFAGRIPQTELAEKTDTDDLHEFSEPSGTDQEFKNIYYHYKEHKTKRDA